MRTLAIALLAPGLLTTAYGGFRHAKDSTALKLGQIELSVKERQRLIVPLWAGGAATVVGGLLFVLGSREP